MSALITIPFHDQTLFAIWGPDGSPMVPVKQFTERLGLAWQTQHRKLMERESFWGITIMVTPSVGGPQETVCIPLSMLTLFLASINPGKVREELREPLERYQKECAEVLYRHFFGIGKAEPEAGITITGTLTLTAQEYADLKVKEALHDQAQARRMGAKLASLKPEQRLALLDAHRSGSSVETLAAAIGVSVELMRSMLSTAEVHETIWRQQIAARKATENA